MVTPCDPILHGLGPLLCALLGVLMGMAAGFYISSFLPAVRETIAAARPTEWVQPPEDGKFLILEPHQRVNWPGLLSERERAPHDPRIVTVRDLKISEGYTGEKCKYCRSWHVRPGMYHDWCTHCDRIGDPNVTPRPAR